MKIEKLYTLSQFVDFIKHSDDKLEGIFSKRQLHKLNLIFAYNDFLKKPLKKEMFVNEIEEPDANDYQMATQEGENKYYNDTNEFQEAEKKVIFNDVEVQQRTIHGEKDVFVEKKFIARIRVDKDWAFNNVTIGDFANMTYGQLELKNIEL